MTVGEVGRVAAASVLLLAANLPSSVRIERLVVPQAFEVDSRGSFLLECDYSVSDTSDLSVEWFFKPAAATLPAGGAEGGAGNHTQLVYRWTPPQRPEVSGVLDGRIQVDPQASEEPPPPMKSRLHVTRPDVRLSGEYTCAVRTTAGTARQTKTLLIYSGAIEKHDLVFEAERRDQEGVLELSCSVKQVYPEPDLRLERFDSPIAQQHQKQQRSDSGGGMFDARTTAKISLRELRGKEDFVCRLALKEAPYQAIRKLTFNTRSENIVVDHTAVTVQTPTVSSTGPNKKSGAGRLGAGAGALAMAAAAGLLILARC